MKTHSSTFFPSILRAAGHGGVLTAVNIVSILVAFGVYYFLRPINQVLVQAPLAALFSLIGFAAWIWLSARLPVLRVQGRRDWIGIYAAALLWTPLLFMPLHFATQGYVSSFDNVLALWAFQAPVNLLAVIFASKIIARERRGDTVF